MVDRFVPVSRLSRPAQWALLLAASMVFAALLRAAGLPAALMLGPMIAGVMIRISGGVIEIHRSASDVAQVVVGCMIAGSFTSAILARVMTEWPLCLAVVSSTVVVSSLLGWAVARARVIPGSTAVWGLSPGAATAMMLMAEEFGADGRLVAFMQYLRVVFVAVAAAVIARYWGNPAASAVTQTATFAPPAHWHALATTLSVAALGAGLGRLAHIPGGLLLGPMVLGGALHASNLASMRLPASLLVASYAIIGWRIGLQFTRPVLTHAVRVLPQSMVVILALMAFCAGVAVILVRLLGVDFLTAYLATSPGGVDSAAIIAVSSPVDFPFIMALQTLRVVMVLLIGPSIAHTIAGRLERESEAVRPGRVPLHGPQDHPQSCRANSSRTSSPAS